MAQGFSVSPILWIFISTSIWMLIRLCVLIIRKQKPLFVNELLFNCFVLYSICLSGITLFPVTFYWVKQAYYIPPSIQLIPFLPIYETLKTNIPFTIKILNIIGNIILTIPFGFFLVMFAKNKLKRLKFVLISGLSLSILIEILQFIEGMVFPSLETRTSDINDVLLNTIGVLIGYSIYRLLCIFFKPILTLHDNTL